MLGRTIVVEGVPREVVGVMPSGFHFPSAAAQLWVPLRLDPGNGEDYWGYGWMPVVARLGPGASLAQAREELRSLIGRIAALFPWPSPMWNADARRSRCRATWCATCAGRCSCCRQRSGSCC